MTGTRQRSNSFTNAQKRRGKRKSAGRARSSSFSAGSGSSSRRRLGRFGAVERGSRVLSDRDAFNSAASGVAGALPSDFASRNEPSRRAVLDVLRREIAGLSEGDEASRRALTLALDLHDPVTGGARQRLDTLLDELGTKPPPTETKLREALAKEYAKALDGKSGQDRRERLGELRNMLDRLPSFFPDELVNAAHSELDRFDAQIAPPGAEILGPSRVPHAKVTGKPDPLDYQHISNRGIQELVRIEGKLYTPVYMSVVADASSGKEHPEYKDFTQTAEGLVEIHTGGSGTGENTLWISFGRPLRQVKWLELYGYKSPAPLLRSFLVPVDVANAISARTITEHLSSETSEDLGVDKHYERNQLGIREPESLEMLRQFALPGSLRTYHNGSSPPKPEWGDARPIAELRAHLGIPEQRLKAFDVFTSARADGSGKGDFTPQGDYAQQAERLAGIYDKYVRERDSLPPNLADAPVDWVVNTSTDAFFQQQSPDASLSKDAFFELVRDWATQAEIAKLVAEDYEDLSALGKKLPDAPPSVIHEVDSGARGQRREAAVALAERNRQVLSSRYTFLGGLRGAYAATSEAFQLGDKGAWRGKLGRMRGDVSKIENDYGFRVGRLARVREQLPGYRETVAKHLKEIRGELGKDRTAELSAAVTKTLREELKAEPSAEQVAQRVAERSKAIDAALVEVIGELERALLGEPADLGPIGKGVPAKPKPKLSAAPLVRAEVRDAGNNLLHPNVTAGGGDCFFHSLHETIHEARSSGPAQQAVRDQIRAAILGNPRLATSHFGSGANGIAARDAFLQAIQTPGTWIPDDGPAVVADALRTRIIIHRPDGSVYYDAQPNVALVGPAQRTVHVEYTGAHYNSYTRNPL